MPILTLATAFASFPTLETERFILREPRPEDADTVFRIMANSQVMRYFGQLPMASHAAAKKRIQGFADDFAEHSGIRWAITRHETDELVGTCGFWRIDKPNLRAEIGYELAPECWGQGVMTEALRPVLAFGFIRMGLHSIEAQIHPANIGSRRVLEKLGFVQEGYFRENYYDPVEQEFTDTAVFSLLAYLTTEGTETQNS
jgi:[ribosomal protein S5]-alanine N-acetyltransferase